MQEEQTNGGVLSVDTDIVCDITSHESGYIDKDLEIIIGLQTDKPLKRAILPFGGIKIVEKALEENGYNIDISNPATNSKEAIQWTYFAYLAAIKEQNGAAMSIGRISTFLDIYLERDLQNKSITEEMAQEYIDDLVIKLRMVRFLRPKEYNEIFAGDPN